jgi:CheY-like chemotaxis protein
MNSSFAYRNVLIVDDTELEAIDTCRILNNSNFFNSLVVKHSALDALNYLQQCLFNRQPLPELILLDMEMPLLDGFDFLDVFMDLNKSFPVKSKIVMLSSSNDHTEIERAIKNPAISLFIRKPLSVESLLRMIQLN